MLTICCPLLDTASMHATSLGIDMHVMRWFGRGLASGRYVSLLRLINLATLGHSC